MSSRIWVVLVLGALVTSGCLGGVDEDAPDDRTEEDDPWDALPCDAAVESERIRGREADLAVDPNDPERLAAGYMASIPSTRDAEPDDEPVWIRIVRSDDGGESWYGDDLPGWPGSPTAATSPFGGSAVTGDPVVAFLPDGTLLLSGIMIRADYSYVMFSARFPDDSLGPTDVVVFSRGAYGDERLNDVWSPGTVLYNDKQEMAVDPDTGTAYVSWMWRHNNQAGGIQSVPVVVMSTDGGKSWSDPHMILGGLGGGLTSEEGHVGQFPFITSDGKAHVVWYAQDRGQMLLSSAPVGTLDFTEPRPIVDGVELSATGNAIGIPLPSVAVGPGPGGAGQSAYIAWADSRHGDANILLIRSDDHAATWTGPLRVTDGEEYNGTDQLVPVVAVSEAGRVGVHYIGFSADASEYHAYGALSADGGQTFTSAVISSEATRMDEATGQRGTGIQGHVGDYFGAGFSNETFVAMWQDGRNGTTDVPFTEMYACRLPLASST